jgi:hypothetical protein
VDLLKRSCNDFQTNKSEKRNHQRKNADNTNNSGNTGKHVEMV